MSARSRRTCVTAAVVGLALLAGRAAKAEDLHAAPIPDSELDDMRGGFLVADGLQFNFGALMSTTVNGQLAFQTQVTFTPTGPQVTQTVGPNAVLGSAVATGTINGLNLQGFNPKDVALLNNGATALVQKITGGAVQNIVLNAADNQNIQQSTQLQLQLPGFAQTQQMFQQNLAMMHLLANGQSSLVH